ncbi:MAG: hypothetical protein WCJ29_06325 [bacterium]
MRNYPQPTGGEWRLRKSDPIVEYRKKLEKPTRITTLGDLLKAKMQNKEITELIPPPVPPKKKESELKHEQISSELTKRADTLQYVIEKTRAIAPTLSGDEVKEALSNLNSEVRGRFSEEARNYAGVLKYLSDEFEALNNSGLSENDLKGLKDLLRVEYASYSRDESARLLYEIQSITEKLVEKNALVRKYQSNPNLLKEKLKEHTGGSISDADIKKVEFSVFDVIVLMSPAIKRKGSLLNSRHNIEVTSGMHFTGEPISIIWPYKLSSTSVEHIKQHESFHNMVDGNLWFKLQYPSYRIESILSRLNTEKDVLTSGEKEESEKALVELKNFDVGSAIDGLHEEVLAALEQIEHGGVCGGYPNMSTLGSQIVGTRELLRKANEENKDKEKKDICEALRLEFRREGQRVAKSLEISLRLGRELGPQALERVHYYLYILRPSQYHHIPKILAHEFPEAKKEPATYVKAIFDFNSRITDLNLLSTRELSGLVSAIYARKKKNNELGWENALFEKYLEVLSDDSKSSDVFEQQSYDNFLLYMTVMENLRVTIGSETSKKAVEKACMAAFVRMFKLRPNSAFRNYQACTKQEKRVFADQVQLLLDRAKDSKEKECLSQLAQKLEATKSGGKSL